MLIVVFVSICLFSFSGIAYSTARNSYEQSKKVTERTKNYYGACNQAEAQIASLKGAPEAETTFSYPFGTGMEELQVTVSSNAAGDDYVITGWMVSDTASWEAPTGGGDGLGPAAPQGDSGGGGGGPQGPQGPTE
jgi:hypothetical protein